MLLFSGNRVLDEFQIRGLFINWWDNNKFELRTIEESGWIQCLTSNFDFEDDDEKEIKKNTLDDLKYFFNEIFDKEISEIKNLEAQKRQLKIELEEEQMNEIEDDDDEIDPPEKILKNEIKELESRLKESKKILKNEIKELESRLKESKKIKKNEIKELEIYKKESEQIKQNSNITSLEIVVPVNSILKYLFK